MTDNTYTLVFEARCVHPPHHGNEDVACGPERQLAALKDKSLDLALDGQLDLEYLLRHHGQHLKTARVC